jgi:hypothetical protein
LSARNAKKSYFGPAEQPMEESTDTSGRLHPKGGTKSWRVIGGVFVCTEEDPAPYAGWAWVGNEWQRACESESELAQEVTTWNVLTYNVWFEQEQMEARYSI